jgi:hypothetical protein
LLALLALAGSSSELQGPAHAPELGRIIHLLHPGDLLFRRGREAVSDLVAGMDSQSAYSHVGIVARQDGVWYVVHAVPSEGPGEPDGVKQEPLADFVQPSRASALGLYRLRPAVAYDGEAVATRAATIASKLAAVHTPFDAGYDLDTPDLLYCTELIWWAYKEAGLNLSIRPRRLVAPFFSRAVIFPSQVESSPYLKQVCCQQ